MFERRSARSARSSEPVVPAAPTDEAKFSASRRYERIVLSSASERARAEVAAT